MQCLKPCSQPGRDISSEILIVFCYQVISNRGTGIDNQEILAGKEAGSSDGGG